MESSYGVVVGLGYVGLSSAVLLAQQNEVIGVDISQDRELAERTESPMGDLVLSQYLDERADFVHTDLQPQSLMLIMRLFQPQQIMTKLTFSILHLSN